MSWQAGPDEAVDLVTTSPPYFVGKEYETGWTWEEYSRPDGGCLPAGLPASPARPLPRHQLRRSPQQRWPHVCRRCTLGVPGRGRPLGMGARPSGSTSRRRASGASTSRAWPWGTSSTSVPATALTSSMSGPWRKPGRDGEEWCADRRLCASVACWVTTGALRLASTGTARPSRSNCRTWAIKVYSREKDEVVLDPFGGSLTTPRRRPSNRSQGLGDRVGPALPGGRSRATQERAVAAHADRGRVRARRPSRSHGRRSGHPSGSFPSASRRDPFRVGAGYPCCKSASGEASHECPGDNHYGQSPILLMLGSGRALPSPRWPGRLAIVRDRPEKLPTSQCGLYHIARAASDRAREGE